ncbi:MAG: hypothetical protein QOG08_1364, partial [Chloroflexota bacterium]|nr:hypothetical protein [Chloroflexota bacterium]
MLNATFPTPTTPGHVLVLSASLATGLSNRLTTVS